MSRASFQAKKRDSAGSPKPREVGGFTSGKNVGPAHFDERANTNAGKYLKRAERDFGERIYKNEK